MDNELPAGAPAGPRNEKENSSNLDDTLRDHIMNKNLPARASTGLPNETENSSNLDDTLRDHIMDNNPTARAPTGSPNGTENSSNLDDTLRDHIMDNNLPARAPTGPPNETENSSILDDTLRDHIIDNNLPARTGLPNEAENSSNLDDTLRDHIMDNKLPARDPTGPHNEAENLSNLDDTLKDQIMDNNLPARDPTGPPNEAENSSNLDNTLRDHIMDNNLPARDPTGPHNEAENSSNLDDTLRDHIMDNNLPARDPTGPHNEADNSSNLDDTLRDPTTTISNDVNQVNEMNFSTNSMETNSSSTIIPGISNTITSSIAPTSGPVLQETTDAQNSDATFKHPTTPRARKRPSSSSRDRPSPERMSSSRRIAEATRDATVLESETQRRKKVNIYTVDNGPQWYETHENTLNISKTIVPRRLPEVYNFLPIFDRPTSKYNMDSFYKNKSKEFFGSSEDDYSKAEKKVGACITMMEGTLTQIQSSIPLAGILNDMLIHNPKKGTSSDDSLTICNKVKIRKEKDVNNMFTKKLKYRGVRLLPLSKEDEKLSIDGTTLNPGKDLMFRIRIYRPFPYNKFKAQYRGRHSVFSRDLILIGRQKLTDLRDSFVCANDVDMRVDISERINDSLHATAKDLFPSGFLFINNVFYVDKRNGCADISARIREWAVIRGLGRYPCKDMSSFTIDQLHVKLGHPEVYIHQGNCEHLFTFSEIRLVNASDPLNLSHYPCHTAISQNQTVYCTTCAEFGAKFIVTGCNRVPFDPAFFCDTCLKLYLYKDGEKVCDFKAYSYRGNEMHSMKLLG